MASSSSTSRPDRVRRRRGARRRAPTRAAIDLRPWVLMPGMVDTARPSAAAPERRRRLRRRPADVAGPADLPDGTIVVGRQRSRSGLAPDIFEAFAAAGTTTVLAYGTVYAAAMEAAFRAAEAHGIRAILGKVMMDRGTYDPIIEPSTILERSLAGVGGPHRALARRRRRAARLRGHAAVRRLLLDRHAPRVGHARPDDRRLVADPRVRGPVRDRGGPPAVPGRSRLRGRLRPRRRARPEDRPGPRRPPLRARAGPPRRDRARGSRIARPPTCSSARASCPWRAGSRRG